MTTRDIAKQRNNEETQLIADILDVYGAHPSLFLWRANTGAAQAKSGRVVKFNARGTADIIGVVRTPAIGRFLAIEAKAHGRTQTDLQFVFQCATERCGGLYVVAYSVADVRVALMRAGAVGVS